MEWYTKIVDKGKSIDVEEQKEALFHETARLNTSEGYIDISDLADETDLQKTTHQKEKLETYILGTAVSFKESLEDANNRISEIVDRIKGLLEYLKESLTDPIETETLFSNIIEKHKKLWELRKKREKSYAEVLVLVESCIRYYDVKELTAEKINSLGEMYSSLKMQDISSTYPRQFRQKIQESGFDIFRPFYVAADKYIVVAKGAK